MYKYKLYAEHWFNIIIYILYNYDNMRYKLIISDGLETILQLIDTDFITQPDIMAYFEDKDVENEYIIIANRKIEDSKYPDKYIVIGDVIKNSVLNIHANYLPQLYNSIILKLFDAHLEGNNVPDIYFDGNIDKTIFELCIGKPDDR